MFWSDSSRVKIFTGGTYLLLRGYIWWYIYSVMNRGESLFKYHQKTETHPVSCTPI